MTNTTKKLVKRNEELRDDLAEQRDALLHCVAQLFDSLDKNTRLMAAHREACEGVREQLLHTNEKVRKIAALSARNKELTEALEKYGSHSPADGSPICERSKHSDHPCTCGFEAALGGKP